jgi:hypothetical protein
LIGRTLPRVPLYEIQLHIVPTLLRDGVRLFGSSGGRQIDLVQMEVVIKSTIGTT